MYNESETAFPYIFIPLSALKRHLVASVKKKPDYFPRSIFPVYVLRNKITFFFLLPPPHPREQFF